MRQFLLGSTAYPSGAVAGNSSYGNVGFAYVDKSDNKMKFTATGEEIDVDGEGYLVLLRKDEDMGNVVLPLHKNHFSYVKGVFDNSKSGKFSAEFTITEVDPFLDYTVIVVKKGKLFNERNKWTATVENVPEYNSEEIIFTGEQLTKIKELKISNQGGLIAFRVANRKLGSYISNDKEIDYKDLLKKIGIKEDEIKLNISFDISIILTENKQYKTTINIDLPVEKVVEDGKSSKEINGKDFIFKRGEF